MSDSSEEEWEENMLKEMAKLFSTMGMNVDYDMLKSLTVSYTHLTLPTIYSV